MAADTLSDIGEIRLIARLARLLPSRPDVIAGVGDDCAVVRAGARDPFDLLLTSDPVIEGVHFGPDAAPAAIGHKALGRVLSDIAAMGGEPLWALVDVVAPARTPAARLEGIYRGAVALARRAGMALVGGDTSRGPVLELHVFGVGRVPRGRALLRSGARPGDILYVTGVLGGSRAGKHLRFAPRLAEGRWLGEGRWASALLDVSDGLATDLRRLAVASRVGIRLDAARVPVAPAARRLQDGRPALAHALGDGEDFELLFTVRRAKAAAFEPAWRRAFRLRCTRIGVVTDPREGIRLAGADGRLAPLRAHGYEHF
jgi:thiamine-monophosphate kinase